MHVLESEGIYLAPQERSPEQIAARFAQMSDLSRARELTSAYEQTKKYVDMAIAARAP